MSPDAPTREQTDRELLEQVAADLTHCRRVLDQIAPYLPLLEHAARLANNPAAMFRRKQKGPRANE